MKRTLIFTIICCFTLSLAAQSWESVKHNTAEYIYGEGWGNSIDEADRHALSALISKIAVIITSETDNNDSLTITNGQLRDVSQFSSSVHTYSQATLTNTERVVIQNEPDAHVGRWIRRSEIEKIFASRIAKVKTMVEAALNAEEKGKADDALRNYYWALTLLKSLQRPNEVSYIDGTGQSHMLMVWIPEQMNEVFRNLSASVVMRNGDDVELYITYKDKPVNSVDYTYYDGRGWSNIYSAKDGCGVLELAPGNQSSSYQLKYEFEYRGQSQIDPELESVLNVVRSTPMRSAYVNIKAKENHSAVKSSAANRTNTYSTTASAIKKVPSQITDTKSYDNIINSVVSSIKTQNYDAVSRHFTPEGWDIYQSIIKYGKAKIVGTPSLQYFQNGNYVIGRGLQMSFSFRHGLRKSFVEDIVFTFNNEGKIFNVAFGLGNTAADDILNKGVWSEQARLSIMNFLENYKTAYGLKRLDYISSIFDDDAVIIVGNVVRQQRLNLNVETGVATMNNNTIIRKNRYTKDQYLDNLKRCFTSNEYINIRFANNDVIKLAKGGELYAIQISQDYYSSSYGDKGYLFLIVDINDPDKPIIKVRTWQPEKDPNFGLYGPGDF